MLVNLELRKPVKIIEITLKDPTETLQATPTSLPTAEPATSQIVRTIAEADLPTISVNGSPNIFQAKCTAWFVTGGKNTDTASRRVYYRALKNDASIRTGSMSVPAGYYWTLRFYFYDVIAGDTIEFRLWATTTKVNWDYDAYCCQCTRLYLFPDERIIQHRGIDYISHPTLTAGKPYGATPGKPRIWNAATPSKEMMVANTWEIKAEYWSPTYGLYVIDRGDYGSPNAAEGAYNATYRPLYNPNNCPTSIKVREFRT